MTFSDTDHAHPHPHPHAEAGAGAGAGGEDRAQLGPSMNGTVMLDIGGDFGALMVMAPETMALGEPEISPVGDDTARTHVAIRERRGPGGIRWAAIYPKLRAGQYTLWGLDGTPADQVTITGGEVAQVDWR